MWCMFLKKKKKTTGHSQNLPDYPVTPGSATPCVGAQMIDNVVTGCWVSAYLFLQENQEMTLWDQWCPC